MAWGRSKGCLPEVKRAVQPCSRSLQRLPEWTAARARTVLLARLALGGRGLAVAPAPPPPPSTAERRKLLRDALRLTLWRATGSTGAWLVPEQVARKRKACGI